MPPNPESALRRPSESLCALLLAAGSALCVLDLSRFDFPRRDELLAVAAALARNQSVRLFSVGGVRCVALPTLKPRGTSHFLYLPRLPRTAACTLTSGVDVWPSPPF